jgi:hypothetical protein
VHDSNVARAPRDPRLFADLIFACAVDDGEAETGPLAASWHGNKSLIPAFDRAPETFSRRKTMKRGSTDRIGGALCWI